MADLSIPLVSRGAEALEALLNYDEAKAEEQVRLLNMSELTYLSVAARRLAAIAGQYVNRHCGVCGAWIAWDALGSGRPEHPRWRHVNAALDGHHRAQPDTGWQSTPGGERDA